MPTKKLPHDMRARLRDEQARQARQATRRRQLIGVAAGVIVVVVAGILIALGTRSSGQSSAAEVAAPPAIASMAATGGTGPGPWAVPADQVDAIKAAGLSPLSAEGTAEHYHAHLDVFVNGTKVPVPADIGIDENAQRISALHTHDASGVIHIETPTKGEPYYLGQLFREWDVALSADQIGGLHTDATHTLTAYVNGKPVAGNPADIQLAAHQEVTVVYGTTSQHVDVPKSYHFTAGL